MNAREIRKALGGRGNKARCPVHKAGKERTPSLSVTDGPDGKLLVNCKAGCSQADVWAALEDLGLVGLKCRGDHSSRRADPAAKPPELTEAERIARGKAKWEASEPIATSPARDHLNAPAQRDPAPASAPPSARFRSPVGGAPAPIAGPRDPWAWKASGVARDR